MFVRSISHTFGNLRIECFIFQLSDAATTNKHNERVEKHSTYSQSTGRNANEVPKEAVNISIFAENIVLHNINYKYQKEQRTSIFELTFEFSIKNRKKHRNFRLNHFSIFSRMILWSTFYNEFLEFSEANKSAVFLLFNVSISC